MNALVHICCALHINCEFPGNIQTQLKESYWNIWGKRQRRISSLWAGSLQGKKEASLLFPFFLSSACLQAMDFPDRWGFKHFCTVDPCLNFNRVTTRKEKKKGREFCHHSQWHSPLPGSPYHFCLLTGQFKIPRVLFFFITSLWNHWTGDLLNLISSQLWDLLTNSTFFALNYIFFCFVCKIRCKITLGSASLANQQLVQHNNGTDWNPVFRQLDCAISKWM